MAIGSGTLLEIALIGHAFDQQVMNVWTYEVGGSAGSYSATQWGESWWNHVKATYRAVATTDYTALFETVRVRELDSLTGDFGEFGIPLAEQAGTRASGAGTPLPPFVAASVRLTVATRLTRPGQKRFAGLTEADISGTTIGAVPTAAIAALMAVMDGPALVLGAPVLLGELYPQIVRRDPVTGLPVARQAVTGSLISPFVSTQNSRKVGHGS